MNELNLTSFELAKLKSDFLKEISNGYYFRK